MEATIFDFRFEKQRTSQTSVSSVTVATFGMAIRVPIQFCPIWLLCNFSVIAFGNAKSPLLVVTSGDIQIDYLAHTPHSPVDS